MPASRTISLIATLAAAAAVAPAAAATISFSTGDYLHKGIGAEFGSEFDVLEIAGSSGSIDIDLPALVTIGSFEFTAGYNCEDCSQTPTFHAALPFSVNGVSGSLGFSYTWSSNGTVDRLDFGTPEVALFDIGAATPLEVNLADLNWIASEGRTNRDLLLARIAFKESPVIVIPEPSTYALMLAGVGALALSARRRRR